MKSKVRKRKRRVSPEKIDKMATLFRKNSGKLILRENLGRDFLAGDDPTTLRRLSCGYIPNVRSLLEEGTNGHTLENVRGKGWIYCQGGIHTYHAVRSTEKRLESSKNKFKIRTKGLVLEKFSEAVGALIEAKKGLVALMDNTISQQRALTEKIDKLLGEKEEQK